jgi:hypothetical protein
MSYQQQQQAKRPESENTLNLIRPGAERFEYARNRYVTGDRSSQDEFELRCQAAALRHLLVHSVMTALLGAVAVGIISRCCVES